MWSGIPAGARPGGRAASWVVGILVAAGVAAMVFAWARASDTIEVSRQVDWASVGLAGVTALCLGLVGSVLIARQAVALRLARLAPVVEQTRAAGQTTGAIARMTAGGTAAPARSNGAAGAEGRATAPGIAGAMALVAAEQMARYHTATCPLAAGKAVRAASRSDHEAAGRRPCGVCRP